MSVCAQTPAKCAEITHPSGEYRFLAQAELGDRRLKATSSHCEQWERRSWRHIPNCFGLFASAPALYIYMKPNPCPQGSKQQLLENLEKCDENARKCAEEAKAQNAETKARVDEVASQQCSVLRRQRLGKFCLSGRLKIKLEGTLGSGATLQCYIQD